MGDSGGVCHQPETAHGPNEHEQRHGKQYVSVSEQFAAAVLILSPVKPFALNTKLQGQFDIGAKREHHKREK